MNFINTIVLRHKTICPIDQSAISTIMMCRRTFCGSLCVLLDLHACVWWKCIVPGSPRTQQVTFSTTSKVLVTVENCSYLTAPETLQITVACYCIETWKISSTIIFNSQRDCFVVVSLYGDNQIKQESILLKNVTFFTWWRRYQRLWCFSSNQGWTLNLHSHLM